MERFSAMLAIKTNSDKLQQSENFNSTYNYTMIGSNDRLDLEDALASEMMWSKKPIKKRANKKSEDRVRSNFELLQEELAANPEIISRTQLNTSQLLYEPEKRKKRTQWSVAILVLIIASIVARLFFV